jgi:hypothetical protein
VRLERAFYRLPLRFESARLQCELERLKNARWLGHPTGFAGNSFLPLISVTGGANDDFAISGPMQPTAALRSSPYLRQVLSALGLPITRCRLMRLEPGAEVPWHDDRNFHWFRRMRFHVPIVTEPEVSFDCGDQTVHMAAGELWTFDNFRRHRVKHGGRLPRIHLVADTKASERSLQFLESSGSPARDVPYDPEREVLPEIEPYEFEILQPDELNTLLDQLEYDSGRVAPTQLARTGVSSAVEHLRKEYSQAFARYGRDAAGEWQYRRLIHDFRQALARCAPELQAVSDALAVIGSMFVTTNRRPGTHAVGAAAQASFAPGTELHRRGPALVRASWFEIRRAERQLEIVSRAGAQVVAQLPLTFEPMLDAFHSPCTPAQVHARLTAAASQDWQRDLALLESLDLLTTPGAETLRVERPIIILSAPRAGSTLLFELLARLPGLYTVAGESHAIIEGLPPLHPRNRGYVSNELGAGDAPDWLAQVLRMRFARALIDRDGARATESSTGQVRMLEKTPKNALRVEFLQRVFPDARFLFLHREAPASLGSLIEGWRSGRFVTYPKLPGWHGMPWSFLLTPNWQQLSPNSVSSIAAEQWRVSNRSILNALVSVPRERWLSVPFSELVHSPRTTLERICSWAELPLDPSLLPSLDGALPLSSFTLSAPAPDKWRRYQAEIEAVLPGVHSTSERLRNL